MEIQNQKEIINKVIQLDKEIKNKKKEQEELKAKLQSNGLLELENKNLKYLQMYGTDGTVDMAYKTKMEIENIKTLKEIFGYVIDAKVETKISTKYEMENKFKTALIALYTGDYKKHNIEEILYKLGLDENNTKLAMKKLKGEYIADKKLLESLGAKDKDGLEEELDAIRENKNYELLERYIDIEKIDDSIREKIKRAISIEESISMGISYEK